MDPAGRPQWCSTVAGDRTDAGQAGAVDATGSVDVAGVTESSDLPVVNAAQPARSGSRDMFVAKMGPGGGPWLYLTYLGGSATSIVRPSATARREG